MVVGMSVGKHAHPLKIARELDDCGSRLDAQAATAIRELHFQRDKLLAALEEMTEVHDEPCRIDHKGFCQSHFLDNVNDGGCRVSTAKAVVAHVKHAQTFINEWKGGAA